MKSLEKFCVSESGTMQDAIVAIQKNDSRCVVVIGASGKVVGVFSEGDVLRAILAGTEVHAPLRNLIKPSFRYQRSRDLTAARPQFLKGITLLPVIDDDFHLTDVLTLKDVFGESSS